MLKNKSSLPTRSQILQSVGKANLGTSLANSIQTIKSPKNIKLNQNKNKKIKEIIEVNTNTNSYINLPSSKWIKTEQNKQNMANNENIMKNDNKKSKQETNPHQYIELDCKSYTINSQKVKTQTQTQTQNSHQYQKNKVIHRSINLTDRQNKNIKKKYIKDANPLVFQQGHYEAKELSDDEQNYQHQYQPNNIDQSKTSSQDKSKPSQGNMISYKEFTSQYAEKIKAQKCKKQILKEMTQNLITQTSKQNLRNSHNKKQASIYKVQTKNTDEQSFKINDKNMNSQSDINKNNSKNKFNQTEKIQMGMYNHSSSHDHNQKYINSAISMSKISKMCSPKNFIKINQFTSSLPQSLNNSLAKSKSKQNVQFNNIKHLNENNQQGRPKKQLQIKIQQSQTVNNRQNLNRNHNNNNKQNQQRLSQTSCSCHQFFNFWGYLLYQQNLDLDSKQCFNSKTIQKLFQSLHERQTLHQKQHLSHFMYQLKEFLYKIVKTSNKSNNNSYQQIANINNSNNSDNSRSDYQNLNRLPKRQKTKLSINTNGQARQESSKKIKIHLKPKNPQRKEQDDLEKVIMENKQQQFLKLKNKQPNQFNKKRLRVSSKNKLYQQTNQIQSIIRSSSKNSSSIDNHEESLTKFEEQCKFKYNQVLQKKLVDGYKQEHFHKKTQNSFFVKNSKHEPICGISSIGHSFGNSIDISMFQDPLHMLDLPLNQQLFQDSMTIRSNSKNIQTKKVNLIRVLK